MDTFDLVIIGAGPGGYVAAIRAAQLGMATALVEKAPAPGGTCLHWGCIPTKTLLHAAELMHAIERAAQEGVQAGAPRIDIAALMRRKQTVVRRLAGGVAGLLKKNGVTVLNGTGAFSGGGRVAVTSGDGVREIAGRAVVIATGSEPTPLAQAPFNGTRIVSSNEAIAFDAVPASLLVVGAGAVGLELGQVWSRFGSQVTIVELMPHVLPGGDPELSDTLADALRAQGMRILTSTTLAAATPGDSGVAVTLKPADGTPTQEVFQKVLVAVGRRPFTAGLRLETIGLPTDRGRIPVDALGRTRAEGVWAIGDVVPGPQLAHLASAEGIAAVEAAAGRPAAPVHRDAIPACTYTDPEAASVGLTEEQARARGTDVKIARFPFAASGKAMVAGTQIGWVKLVADRTHDQILGAHIVGPHATELIAEATLAVQLECTCAELAHTIHAHPTLSEAMAEAAHAGLDGALHF